MKKEREVKCLIINNDISMYEYEILEGVKTYQVEIIGKSGKKYIINFNTKQEAKNFIEHINK